MGKLIILQTFNDYDYLWEIILEKCNKNPLQNLTSISESIFIEINPSISIKN